METMQISTPPAAMNGAQPKGLWSRDEHSRNVKNVSRDNGGSRQPRRSRTLHEEFQTPAMPYGFGEVHLPSNYQVHAQDHYRAMNGLPSPISEVPPALENGDYMMSLSITSDSSERSSSSRVAEQAPQPVSRIRQLRPTLPPPRRSYSVTDQEPVPHHHRLSSVMTLLDLPGEVHYAIFDFLDPLDSTCFGLTNRHMYGIHRRLHGTVPLSIRRAGPNDMEWAWHRAGQSTAVTAAKPAAAVAATEGEAAADDKERKALEKTEITAMRVRGQAYCRKCGISRCELHKHIRDWMGENYEYCSVRQKFGPKAPEGARSFCYLSNPKNPGRCGRHRVAKAQPPSNSVQF
ncbi:hypothetical protein MCOR25_002016 [Pyricularia grisea]|nr:hypothetical protein MCOR25_002016 [Pyricularia grisea]